MTKPRLLDLFCSAGGSAYGYMLAGFHVTGVDIRPQPRYIGDEFHQADALEYLAAHGHEYAAIHASPPCQAYTDAARQWRIAGKEYPDLVAATREALKATGKPYVIENVPGAPLINPVVLNGAKFGLLVNRTRLFECSFPVPFELLPPQMPPVKMGRRVQAGQVITPVGNFSNVAYAREQMGIDWMTQTELAQAIPPAYCEYIGAQLLAALQDH
jgi:DNA (cytosine-5)-methyltransferase 1